MDDYPNKAKFLNPGWEITTAELVHEMAEDYMRRGMNIPESIIARLLSYQMSLGDAAHKNYVIIDDWVSEALHHLHVHPQLLQEDLLHVALAMLPIVMT